MINCVKKNVFRCLQTDFVLVIVAIALCSAEKLENPCQGRKDGFARDLKNCQQYYSCNDEGMPSLGICEPDFVFDAGFLISIGVVLLFKSYKLFLFV